jgi:hypothetical protein
MSEGRFGSESGLLFQLGEHDFLIQNSGLLGGLRASSLGKNRGFSRCWEAGGIEYWEFEATGRGFLEQKGLRFRVLFERAAAIARAYS